MSAEKSSSRNRSLEINMQELKLEEEYVHQNNNT
jgi:hypothetical protein